VLGLLHRIAASREARPQGTAIGRLLLRCRGLVLVLRCLLLPMLIGPSHAAKQTASGRANGRANVSLRHLCAIIMTFGFLLMLICSTGHAPSAETSYAAPREWRFDAPPLKLSHGPISYPVK
jgi:hypothetical protein